MLAPRSPRHHRPPLIGVPLALLVPLGVLGAIRWRADHPPLTRNDRLLRAKVRPSVGIWMVGWRAPWQRISGLPSNTTLMVSDKAALSALWDALRCSDDPVDTSVFQDELQGMVCSVYIPDTNKMSGFKISGFQLVYRVIGSRRYIEINEKDKTILCAQVQPHFVPRVEALIRQCAQAASAPGQHLGFLIHSY